MNLPGGDPRKDKHTIIKYHHQDIQGDKFKNKPRYQNADSADGIMRHKVLKNKNIAVV